jgi:hypothetical protein
MVFSVARARPKGGSEWAIIVVTAVTAIVCLVYTASIGGARGSAR